MSSLRMILLVDDDPVIREIVEFAIESLGEYDVVSANDGKQALEILDQVGNVFSLILCDLNMPEMDGVEFFRNLKQRDFKGKIGILSGEDNSIISLAEDLAQTHQLDIVGTLSKPVNPDKLEALLVKAQETSSDSSAKKPEHVTKYSKEDLKAALLNREIIPYYQPKVHVGSGMIEGVEVLARWDHPTDGIVSPFEFIPLAESEGLINDLTFVIFEAALEDAERWKATGFNPMIAVNLSADILCQIELPDELANMAKRYQVDTNNIILEITESKLLESKAVPMEVLARLRLKGFELSIDDFGTAYSNIEYLQKFPFNELKIDRAFIGNAASNEQARATVETCALIGKKMGLRTVAEGVETDADLAIVRDCGIDVIQGFYYSKPLSSNDLLDWIEAYQPRQARRAAS